MILSELLEKLPKEKQEEFYKDVMRRQSRVLMCDSILPSREGFTVTLPKGTTELLSPEGEILMRDDEVIESPPMKLTYGRRVSF